MLHRRCEIKYDHLSEEIMSYFGNSHVQSKTLRVSKDFVNLEFWLDI